MNYMLQRLFKIQPGEEQRVFLFSLLGALLTGGLAVGMSAVDALFLTGAGADKLPLIYVLTPVVMIIYIPIFTYLLTRVGIDRLFDITLAILFIGGLTLYVLLSGHWIKPSLPLLIGVKLYVNMWLFALYSLYWNFTDSYFDILDGKRLFAFFSAGSAFGAMIGGALVAVLIPIMPVAVLFLVWSGIALLTAPLLVYTRRRAVLVETDDSLDETDVGFLDQMRQLLNTMRNSRFMVLLSLVIFTTLSITLICEYQYMSIFSTWAGERAAGMAAANPGLDVEALSARELASLFGKLGAAANAFTLLVNLFLFNRLIMRIGVRNMALVQPLVYILTFTYLLLAYNFPAALLGFFAYQGIMTAIEQNNQNFLFNALPSQGKKQLRTFIEGICEPMAVAIAGGFLIIYGRDVGTDQINAGILRIFGEAPGQRFIDFMGFGQMTATGISAIGLGGALVALLIVLGLRHDYVHAMVINLKKSWLDFSRPLASTLHSSPAQESDALVAHTRRKEPDHALAAIRLLKELDRTVALRALLEFWKDASQTERQNAQPLFSELLTGEDIDAERIVMQWLEEEQIELDPALIEELGSRRLLQAERILPLIDSPSPDLQGAASVALWSSWHFDHGLDSFQTIRDLLKGTDAERCIAIRALGRTGQERYAHSLLSHLSDPSPTVQHETLRAILRLVTHDSTRVIPDILRVIEEGDTALRVLGMETLTRIGDSSCIRPLLALGRSFSPYERRKASDMIVQIGLQSVPAIVSVLQDRGYPHKARSVAARALAQLSFPQLEALEPEVINDELHRAYRFAVAQATLQKTPQTGHGLPLLLRLYQDMQEVIVDFVLEMMTISGRLPSFELLSASLRSPNPKERANTVETIEQGCTADLFNQLMPLIGSRDERDKLRIARSRHQLTPPPLNELLDQALESSLPIECSSALQSVWEAGGPDAAEALRNKLLVTRDEQIRQTILELLDKSKNPESLTVMDRLSLLARTPFFASFGIEELAICAKDMEDETIPADTWLFREGDPADALYVIVDGSVELEDAGVRWTRTAGESMGEDAVMGFGVRAVGARSLGVRVLKISRQAILNTARTYPRIAIGLLVKKWV